MVDEKINLADQTPETDPQELLIPGHLEEALKVSIAAGREEERLREAADRKHKELLATHILQSDAAEIIGIQHDTLSARINRISSEDRYLENGRRPQGKIEKVTVKGSDLYWRHPYNKKIVLLNKTLVEAMKSAEAEYKELLNSNDYIDQPNAANELKIERGTLVSRSRKFVENKYFLEDGTEPRGISGEITMPGSQLRWQHPYNQSIVLLKKSLVAAMKLADIQYNELLNSNSYVVQYTMYSDSALADISLIEVSDKIVSDKDYLEDGTEPKGILGERTLKGSELRWKHPYTQIILLRKSFVEGIQKAENKLKAITDNQSYIPRSIAATEINIELQTLELRLKKFDSDKDYLEDGSEPKGVSGEIIIKGKEFVWEHPYSLKKVYIRKSLVDSMKLANKKSTEMLDSGNYVLQSEAVKDTEIGESLRSRTAKINPDKNYLEDGNEPKGTNGEMIVKGSELRWEHPYNSLHILISQKLIDPIKKANEEQKSLLDSGNYSLQSAIAKKLDMSVTLINSRAKKIDSNKHYLEDGTEPKGISGEIIILGSKLRWQHPYNPAIVILRNSFIEGMKKAEDEYKEILTSKQYLVISDAAKEIGMTYAGLLARSRLIKLDAHYLEDGTKPKGISGEITLPGSQLRWQHPYNPKCTMLRKSLITRMKTIENEARTLLQSDDYIEQAKAANIIGIPADKVMKRTRTIDPEGDYLDNGKEPEGKSGEVTVKGSVLRWQHPYNAKIVHLHKNLVYGMKAAEDEYKKLLASGDYVEQIAIAKDIGIDNPTLLGRTVKINPNEDYLEDGRNPEGKTGEVTVKGSVLKWKHPYNGGIVLLHKKLTEGMKAAEDEYKKLLASGDYENQADITKRSSLSRSAVTMRTAKISSDKHYLEDGFEPKGISGEITIPGSQLRWQHPYNPGIILLYKKYAATILEAKGMKVKSSASEKIGEAVPEKIPEDTKAELDKLKEQKVNRPE